MVSNYLSNAIEQYEILDNDTQFKLIKLAQDGDLEARDQLILSNLRLVVHIAKQFNYPEFLELDDLVMEGILGIDYAISLYDFSKKRKISSWFADPIRWKISSLLKKYKEIPISLNEVISSDDENRTEFLDQLECPKSSALTDEWESKEDLRFLFSFLTELEQIVLILSYGLFEFDTYAAEEMRPIFDRTSPAIINLKNRTLQKMKMIAYQNSKEEDENIIDNLPTYPFIDLDKLSSLIKEKKLVSKREKWKEPGKRRKGMKPELDLTEVNHNFTFKQGKVADEFIETYKDSILKDYHLGCNRSALSRKYRCPGSVILKLLKEAGEIE